MAYKQVKKYGYRDSLEKGDPEKVIYGVDFDTEFEAIEQAFDDLMGGDSTIDPTDPAFEDVVFQNRPEAQKVISEFTFEKAGDSPLTMKNTGMYAGTAYIRYTGVTWEVDPSLSVTGDITAGGNLTVDGTTQLNGDLSVDGNIGATGNISLDGNLTVGGVVEGDLTVNGNITIDGGSITDPDGNPAGGIADAPSDGEIYARQNETWVPLPDEADPYDDSWIQPALDLKSDDGHGHAWTEITGKPPLDNYAHWKLQAGGGATENITTGASVNFAGSGDTTVTRSGTTITISSSSGGGGGLPDGDWHCTGSITAAGNITAYSSSDERLKDDITPMPVGLIDDIKPVQFKWKDGGKSSGGVIAQQLQEIGLDDFVNEAPNGDLGVDYNALVGVLLAEVIDLKKRLSDDS